MIEIANRSGRRCPRGALRRALSHTLRAERKRMDLSVAVVEARQMRALNRRHLGEEGVTDVLSFSLGPVGEIVLCACLAREEALWQGHPYRSELVLYAVHGLLHLLGYDDTTPPLSARMRRRQERILKDLGHRP
jgi:probable rRNA maturation factor